MQAIELKIGEHLLTEEEVTNDFLRSLGTNSDPKPTLPGRGEKIGVTNYPILEFDERALCRLHDGVEETLKYSKVKPAGGKFYEFCKRAFDIVASAFALTILAVPIGIVALLIYIDDKGNPFFSQVRLTKNGKPFRMYKLRTMCVDAEARFAEVQKDNQTDGLAFKNDHDPRITRLGGVLRKLSIDELPQLVNTLKGDMSIIGPRPPLPREVVLYTPEQMDRLLVKGGLSCICQTEGRSDMEFDKWVEGDVKYIKNRNALLDVKLMFKTVGAVLLRKGAK
ncbi:MAG: sugar transferase [Oscillospiraceae bacterium]|nr:sugar transferase [Oscillospiraceae bacterium]